MPAYPSPADDKLETLRTNYIGLASFTALIWDHIDTFADEVEYIWKGRKGPFIYLFFFNRYFTPLGFIINLHAYLSPSWTPEVHVSTPPVAKFHPPNPSIAHIPESSCARFVKYEGCTVSLAVEVSGLMMLLRIRAIYSNQIWITALLSTVLAIETGVNIWLISHAGPVIHSPLSGVHACSMVFDHTKSYSGVLASSSAWIPLLYDTIIFGLTLYKTIPPLRRAEASYIIQRLFEDGLLYYSVIVSVTLVLTIMIISAPEGTKNIAAQLEQLITVAMMSRITLNLRKVGRRHQTQSLTSHHTAHDFWLLRLLPGSRWAMEQLWERNSFFQFSFHDNTTTTTAVGGAGNAARTSPQPEDIELRPSLSRPRRNSLSIHFVVPDTPHDSTDSATSVALGGSGDRKFLHTLS